MSVKICFLICGLPRTIDMVINNIEDVFSNSKYIINYVVCISKNNNDTTCNKLDLNFLVCNDKIRRIIIIENDSDNSFKNCINYSKKIKVSIENIDNNSDMYIIIRSDFIFINDDFIESIEDSNKLYFSDKFNDVKDINFSNNKINEYIIIAKKYEVLKHFINFYDYCINNHNFCNINLYKFINEKKYEFNLIQIDYKLILSKCNILAISGDSGSGKTTLMKYLLKIYNETNVLKLETDRYHKWERGDINYEKYTHLHPNANYLEMMSEDVYNLKIGNNIYQVDYDHNSGKFTDKQKITSNENIILCGLHTLYNTKLNNIIDIKIFMDTDRELIKKWKINRDTNERGYTIEKILKQIEMRNEDYYSYIHSQCANADIIINYYENNENENCFLKCNLKIKNKNIIASLYKYFIKYNYNFNLQDNILSIVLKNDFFTMYISENINTKFPDIILEEYHNKYDNYYNEILLFFILYLFT